VKEQTTIIGTKP